MSDQGKIIGQAQRSKSSPRACQSQSVPNCSLAKADLDLGRSPLS